MEPPSSRVLIILILLLLSDESYLRLVCAQLLFINANLNDLYTHINILNRNYLIVDI